MSISQFADKLRCQYCGKSHGTKGWPVNGDDVAFYFQEKPGDYTLEVTCPHCGRDWCVVWDNDPGPIEPLVQEDVRQEVVSTLGQTDGAKAVESLIQALKDENAYVRAEAVMDLGRTEDASAIEPLIALLKDRDENVRESTCFALGWLGPQAKVAIPSLIEVLKKDKEDSVRSRAAGTLAEFGSDAVPLIIELLGHKSPRARYDAAWVLSTMAENGDRVSPAIAVPHLIPMLSDKETVGLHLGARPIDVRYIVIDALGAIGNKEAIDALREAWNDTKSKFYRDQISQYIKKPK